MVRASITCLAVGALVLAACGADDTSAPPAADPTTPAPAATSVASTTSPTTMAPTTLATTTTTTTAIISTTSTTNTTTTTTTTTTNATTTTATTSTEPLPSTTTPPDPSTNVIDGVLRPDGLGPYDFGTDRALVEAWLTGLLGRPTTDPGGLVSWIICGPPGWCADATVLTWPTAGLSVALLPPPEAGSEQPRSGLQAWTVTDRAWWPGQVPVPGATWSDDAIDVLLTTGQGSGLGSTVTELESALPSVGFLGWHAQAFQPSGFYVTGADGDSVLEGDLDWNVVIDVQSALNDHGAELVVDGIPGPATRSALEEFEARHDLDGGFDTMEALGIVHPDPAAHVIRLSGGSWFWELDCGVDVLGLSGC